MKDDQNRLTRMIVLAFQAGNKEKCYIDFFKYERNASPKIIWGQNFLTYIPEFWE